MAYAVYLTLRVVANSLLITAGEKMNKCVLACALAGASVFRVASAEADVTISSAATQNVTCSAGTCAPTAKDAVLNIGDLETLLGAGDVVVTTTGSGVDAGSLRIVSALSWSNASNLELDSKGLIFVSAAVSSLGGGGINLSSSDGSANGPLVFGTGGNISFADISSKLVINDTPYMLVDGIDGLAKALAQNAMGNYALASSYDAGKDKPFKNTPIATDVAGTVEGLGNTVANIRISATGVESPGGLFPTIATSGAVRNLRISALQMKIGIYQVGSAQTAGGFANSNEGLLFGDSVTGTVSVNAKGSYLSYVGGIVAENSGTLESCSSSDAVITEQTLAGGIAGSNSGVISNSFATGKVTSLSKVPFIEVGGLVADNSGTISNTYATGDVRGTGTLEDENAPTAGGLVGTSEGLISDSYSTGRVSLSAGFSGGFAGDISYCSHCYWDTSTSKTAMGAGEGKRTDLVGETSKELRLQLPKGFAAHEWSEKKGINTGLPYLRKNPPPA